MERCATHFALQVPSALSVTLNELTCRMLTSGLLFLKEPIFQELIFLKQIFLILTLLKLILQNLISGKLTFLKLTFLKLTLLELEGITRFFHQTFTDALRAAKEPEPIAKALIRHSNGSVTAQYGSGYPLDVLYGDLMRVDYLYLELSHFATNGSSEEKPNA